MSNDVPVYNPNDGLYGRSGGPYIDEEQAREAEIRRARVEGREPDLDNPGAYAGIQLQTAAQMIANNVLDVNRVGVTNVQIPGEDIFEQSAKSDKTNLKVQDKIPAAAFDPNGLGKAKTKKAEDATLNPSDPNAAADEQMVFDFNAEDGKAAGADAKQAEDKAAADKAKADAKKSTSASKSSSTK